ncbi:virulence factor BrkB family protein [Pseudidiomarina insulisalsae]|uniref:UPF0761 membrane protein CWI71_01170 n=1 Tax=Pseudidiomarina insulisalsae TaxID=575789 RepID=A0A432YQP2_9GAMM|nr:virulence factor BrkB family protein [Pseudidiomarina insulisalsae]RUO63703.1 hypothetical protein CWI71_01170 [Pseudidiomarina insulisalsae]
MSQENDKQSSVWQQRMQCAWQFLLYYVRRCFNDRVTIIAGHLTFVSMLALVPLLVVIFSIFSAFPMFDVFRQEVEAFLFANLLPASGEEIKQYLNEFISNVSQMTAIGAIFVIVVAVNLLSTIDTTMNRIWRNTHPRRLPVAFAVYWMILTLGPILIGSGMAVSSYLVSLTAFAESYVSGLRKVLLAVVPVFTTMIAFLLMYVMLPNRVVKIRHAIWGALLAAILFELSKTGFAIYVTNFASYKAIYGALAAIPILLLWIYLSWTIVLIGAELTASIEEFFEEDDESTTAESDESAG